MEDRIYIAIAKVLQGEATDAEQQEVAEWLRADEQNAKVYADMKAVWADADVLKKDSDFDTAAAWNKVSGKIDWQEDVPAERKGRTIGFPLWMKYSTALAAILVIGFFLFNPFRSDTMQVLADAGNQRVELPDGSVITLKKGSKLIYPRSFAQDTRTVSLEGEGFFEVARNEQKPFVVNASPIKVTVLGTSFNVRTQADRADVVVATGKVQVAASGGETEAVILTPGKAAHYEHGTIAASNASGDELFWNDGTLSFHNQPLEEVVRIMARATSADIVLDSALSPRQRQQEVTISFRNQPMPDMLTELCLITGCRWEKQQNRYLVRSK